MQKSCFVTLVGLLIFFGPSFSQVAEEESMVIGKIIFQGVESFSGKTLQKRMRTKAGQPFDEFTLRQDMRRIEGFYEEKGFLEARVTEHKLSWDLKGKKVDVTFSIEEGVRTTVRMVEVIGNQTIRDAEILRRIALEPEQPLDQQSVAVSELAILSLYAESGRIYSEVTSSTEAGTQPHRVDLIFHVREGPLVRVGKIEIEGNRRVRPRIVEREITFTEGDTYDPEKVYESQRRIYGTGLFKDVKLELKGIEEKRQIVDITFHLVEEGPKWFGVGAGYQSPDRIRLNGEWGHNNLFNNGQRLTLNVSYSSNLKGEHREEFEARHLEPYFISSPFKLMLRPFHYRERGQSYLSKETGGSANIGRYFGRHLYGSLQCKFKFATLDTFGIGERPKLEATTNSISVSYAKDTRDSYFDPKKGSLHALSFERAGGILGGSNNFNRFILDSSMFLSVLARATLALRLKQGYTITFGATTPEGVSSDERFELGGANSLRGYREASVGPVDPITKERNGIIMTNLNLELRFPLPLIKNLNMGYFVDSGGMWMERKEMRVKDLKWGAGVGLRWIIPYLGPIRFDWGWKLADGEEPDRWQWYLAFGHAF